MFFVFFFLGNVMFTFLKISYILPCLHYSHGFGDNDFLLLLLLTYLSSLLFLLLFPFFFSSSYLYTWVYFLLYFLIYLVSLHPDDAGLAGNGRTEATANAGAGAAATTGLK